MRLFVLFAALVLTGPALATERYRLKAPEDVATFLQAYLPDPQQAVEVDDDDRLGLGRRLRTRAVDLLATEGYFSPTISLDLDNAIPTLIVTPGPRTQVTQVDVQFTGALADDPRYAERMARLRSQWALPAGQAFRAQDWADAKIRLVQKLATEYFAAARLAASSADVDPETASAHLHLEVDSGPAYTLGALRVEGLMNYPPELLERYNPLHPGEAYNQDRLLALQAALQATPYFSYVEVSADMEHAEAGMVPVRVVVQESMPHRFSAGVGFSTNTGGRLDLGLREANFLSRAWSLNTGLRIEQKRQALFADVFLPPDDSRRRNSLGTLIENTYIKGLRTHHQAIGIARDGRTGDIETRLGLSLQSETNQPDGAERTHNQALALDWSWSRRKVDDPLNPRAGYAYALRIGAANQYLLSDTDFVRTWARTAAWIPVASRDVIALRLEGGRTFAKSRTDVPEEFLFRAGGAQSVRGYDYLSLGVSEGQAIVGGRYLASGSVEYTHWLPSAWGVAAFVDAGNASDNLDQLRPRLGTGLGGRWKSPAGPLALDLAYGWHDHTVRAHLSIAIAF